MSVMAEESRRVEAVASPEDLGRADLYALLAALFYAAPDAGLLALVADTESAGEPDSALRKSWEALRGAAREADAGGVRQEFDDLFKAPGRAPVMPYGSYHRTGMLMDRPLVELRQHLGRLGLGRREGVGEPEDHFSGLCEVMRILIAGGSGVAPVPMEVQKEFFEKHIAPWYRKLVAEIRGCAQADFYRHAGGFAEAFLDVEALSFNIES